MKPKDLIDSLVIMSITEDYGIIEAASSLLIFEMLDCLFVYVDAAMVHKDMRGKGLGTILFQDIANYMDHHTKGKNYKGAYMVVQ